MTQTAKKWNDEAVATLQSMTANESPVSVASVEAASEALGFSVRSVASKLRQLDREVESMAKAPVATFTADEGAALSRFVSDNAGRYTYAEIAANFADGKFTTKQVQGKILALDLTKSVKPTEKVEVARTYTEAEESQFVSLANAGKFLEDIAAALSKEIASVRGKALSLMRNGTIAKIPTQRDHATPAEDKIDALGAKIATMTVAEIAEAVEKTERGVKTALTRRGITVADYDGKAKQEKAAGKKAA